jgi:hypothetical protein
LDALDGSVSVTDDAHAFSAVPFGQPLFCYLMELLEGNKITNGSRVPLSSIRSSNRFRFRHKKTRKEAV